MSRTDIFHLNPSNVRNLFYTYVFRGWNGYELGKKFGNVPFALSADSVVVHDEFAPLVPFDEPRPYGLPEDVVWDTNPPFPKQLRSMIGVRNGSVDTEGFVFDEAGWPVDGACHAQAQMLRYRWKKRRDGINTDYMQALTEPVRFDGRIFAVTASTQHCYYHWIMDVLPRLMKALAVLGPDDVIYMQTDRFRFQRDTLKYFGSIADRIVDADQNPWVQGREVIVPCHQVLNGYRYNPWVLDCLRDRFLPESEPASADEKVRIYVSRARAGTRRVVNEDEVFAVLEPLGFRKVMSEELSFSEQVDLFRRSEAIVAPHGAGLTNIVFSDPGTKILELFPSRSVDAYHRLSDAMGHPYAFVKKPKHRRRRRANENFDVNIEHLKRTLEHLDIR